MASSFTACKSLSVIDGRLADHSHRHVFALRSVPSAVSFSSSPSGFYALRASKVSLQWASSKSSLLWVSPIRQGGLKKVAVMVNASEDVEEIVEEVEEETSSGFDENFGGRQFVESPEEAKLYVGNLPFDVNAQMLGELFEGAGQVLDVNVISRKTWYPKAADHENVKKMWYIVDATDKRLGRLASTIAIHIRGKNLPTYTPSVDMGEYVIVVNAENIAVTGNKRSQKVYKRFSGRPGGLKEETFDCLQKRIPERIIEHAVRGMLPKGRLGRRLFTHLKVYKGPNHPHEAQKPVPLPIMDKRIIIEK